jgi:DNA-binding Xre family transcriptional regulator
MSMHEKQQEKIKYGEVKYMLGGLLYRLGITVKEAAAMADMNPLVLRRSIENQTAPSFQQLARICSALNVGLEDLLEYIPPDQL